MIKNDILYYLAIFIICLIVANITSSIFASFMIFSGVGLGILVMFIGLAVGRSAFAFTNLFSSENNELTISEENYTTRLSISSFISSFSSMHGAILGEMLYDTACYDNEKLQYVEEPMLSYVDVFTIPFEQLIFNFFGLMGREIEYLIYYFQMLPVDGTYAVTSIVFLALAVYFGYNSAWGTRYSLF